jgi:hypothetical protein
VNIILKKLYNSFVIYLRSVLYKQIFLYNLDSKIDIWNTVDKLDVGNEKLIVNKDIQKGFS